MALVSFTAFSLMFFTKTAVAMLSGYRDTTYVMPRGPLLLLSSTCTASKESESTSLTDHSTPESTEPFTEGGSDLRAAKGSGFLVAVTAETGSVTSLRTNPIPPLAKPPRV
uniref:Secreted protein n=1 Tax=Opuntia streptacantha TaxID=393608 RepID=A0A7C9D1E2_OPUST